VFTQVPAISDADPRQAPKLPLAFSGPDAPDSHRPVDGVEVVLGLGVGEGGVGLLLGDVDGGLGLVVTDGDGTAGGIPLARNRSSSSE
jgi:hypothetical protein